MTNAHDRRTLEERLQWIADWSEPGIDLADAGTAREALDKLRAQAAEIERLTRRIEDAAKDMREAAAKEAMTDRTIDAHGAHCRCTTCELNIVEDGIRCIPTGQFRRREDVA